MVLSKEEKTPHVLLRARTWYAVIICICAIILIRLFYLQVIKHSYYKNAALQGQFKEYEIPAERGSIDAYDGNKLVPIVLNEKRYTLFVDPKFIDDVNSASEKIARVIGGNANDYATKMKLDTRYSVLRKKLSRDQKKSIDELEIKGVGTRDEPQRVYPQGSLASQLLGFVNDEGVGKYGIEQYLDSSLKGKPGQLKAITDSNGVPLVANSDNISIDPQPGKKVVLTLDISMQRQLEDILKAGLNKAESKSGSALIMDPNTGAIKAMANFPTYNPADFSKEKDAGVFNNGAVSSPLEVGSIMKPLTTAAALNSGSIKANDSFYDPGYFVVDSKKITNVEEVAGSATRPVVDILRLSLNTGATWLLMQMGGGKINEKARTIWYDYMSNHYRLGMQTGIEQGYEEAGHIPKPNEGFGLNIQYANTAFGQGMSATPLQMGAAISSIVNGGTYYRPRLVDQVIEPDGSSKKTSPEVLKNNVVKPEVSKTIKAFMEEVVKTNYLVYGMKSTHSQYSVGGKTGTAQITGPDGGYYKDRYNGMFMGFVGGDKPEYVIMVRVNDPGISGYAGSKGAGPIFAATVDMLINNFALQQKSRK